MEWRKEYWMCWEMGRAQGRVWGAACWAGEEGRGLNGQQGPRGQGRAGKGSHGGRGSLLGRLLGVRSPHWTDGPVGTPCGWFIMQISGRGCRARREACKYNETDLPSSSAWGELHRACWWTGAGGHQAGNAGESSGCRREQEPDHVTWFRPLERDFGFYLQALDLWRDLCF